MNETVKKPKRRPHDCCNDPGNLTACSPDDNRPELVCELCVKCGCRHFTLLAADLLAKIMQSDTTTRKGG